MRERHATRGLGDIAPVAANYRPTGFPQFTLGLNVALGLLHNSVEKRRSVAAERIYKRLMIEREFP
jgi:hypothetical protein